MPPVSNATVPDVTPASLLPFGSVTGLVVFSVFVTLTGFCYVLSATKACRDRREIIFRNAARRKAREFRDKHAAKPCSPPFSNGQVGLLASLEALQGPPAGVDNAAAKIEDEKLEAHVQQHVDPENQMFEDLRNSTTTTGIVPANDVNRTTLSTESGYGDEISNSPEFQKPCADLDLVNSDTENRSGSNSPISGSDLQEPVLRHRRISYESATELKYVVCQPRTAKTSSTKSSSSNWFMEEKPGFQRSISGPEARTSHSHIYDTSKPLPPPPPPPPMSVPLCAKTP